ncbi:MAG: cytochrome c [Verrucomicrobiota bacterium]
MSEPSSSEKFSLAAIVGIGGSALLVLVLLVSLGIFGAQLLGGVNEAARDAKVEAIRIAAENAEKERLAALKAAEEAASPSEAVSEASVTPVVAEIDPAIAHLQEVGKGVYMQCAACHGPEGKSLVPNMAPNLAGSEVVNGSTEALAAILLNGIQQEGRFLGAMVGWKAMLSDEQIAGVLTYIRANFGNESAPITEGMLATAREKYAGVNTPMLRGDLVAIQDDLPEG